MIKYYKAKIKGSVEGIKSAKKDIKNASIKKYIPIKDMDILSKLYDKGYVDSYNKYVESHNKCFEVKDTLIVFFKERSY